jgi:hypothetical protein
MPAQPIDLTPFHDEISHQINQLKWKQPQIIQWLQDTHGLVVSRYTLMRRLTDMGITSHHRTQTSASDEALIDAIRQQYHTTLDNDKEIVQTLQNQGIATTQRQVKSIRLSHGWRHRQRTDSDKLAAFTATYAAVDEALEEGTVRDYGRELLQSNLLVNGFRGTEHHIRDALAILAPAATADRRSGPGKKKRKGEFTTQGPDWVWSIDGHDKFRDYGIFIYAAIDGCSRMAKWGYVGNSNRTQVSVASQYLSVIRDGGLCPAHIRSDRGGETLMLAEAQYSFYLLYLKRRNAHLPVEERLSNEDINNTPVRKCYWFGTSPANTRVESFWNRLINSQTNKWLSYFPWLRDNGLYSSDRVADRVVFLYVFIPIIRGKVVAYIKTQNKHRIRAQADRPNSIPGRPSKIYESAWGRRCGFKPDPNLLSGLTACLKGYSTLLISLQIYHLIRTRSRRNPLRFHFGLAHRHYSCLRAHYYACTSRVLTS